MLPNRAIKDYPPPRFWLLINNCFKYFAEGFSIKLYVKIPIIIQNIKLYKKANIGCDKGYVVFQKVACKIIKHTSCIKYIEKDGLESFSKKELFKILENNPAF